MNILQVCGCRRQRRRATTNWPGPNQISNTAVTLPNVPDEYCYWFDTLIRPWTSEVRRLVPSSTRPWQLLHGPLLGWRAIAWCQDHGRAITAAAVWAAETQAADSNYGAVLQTPLLRPSTVAGIKDSTGAWRPRTTLDIKASSSIADNVVVADDPTLVRATVAMEQDNRCSGRGIAALNVEAGAAAVNDPGAG